MRSALFPAGFLAPVILRLMLVPGACDEASGSEIFEDENFYTYIRVSSAALKDRAGSLNRPLLLHLACFVHSLARMVRRFFSFLSQFDANNSVVFLNSWGGEIVNRLTRLKGIESFRSTVRPVEEKENVRRIDCTARAQSRLLGHGAYTCKG